MSAYTNPRESVFNQPKPVVHLPRDLLDAIVKGVEPYPIPAGRKYEYGTAGVCTALSLLFQILTRHLIVSHESVCLILHLPWT